MNIQLLKKEIEEMNDGELRDSLLESVSLIEEELKEQQNLIEEKNSEIAEQDEQIKELEEKLSEPDWNTVELGLDTLYFSFENNNLQIRQEFDEMVKRINKIPNAEILI